MASNEKTLEWEKEAFKKFELMINKMPVFHRRMADRAVKEKAQALAKARGACLVEEQDIIQAFFTEVPTPFYSLMIRLLEDVKFDYKKYGLLKNGKK